jgi:serine protease Do
MSRRFLAAMVGLSAIVGLLLGLLVAGSLTPSPALSSPTARPVLRTGTPAPEVPGVVSFADIAERINPAVVNIDATTRGPWRQRRPLLQRPGMPEPFERSPERDRDGPRRGTASGLIIDAEGHILTNLHVVESAERLSVRLANGRTLAARRVGVDSETDIALLKVDGLEPFPFAPLGDSDGLRVGDWVVAIGHPLEYEHTVTVGVVSFLGRKLFDPLDRYIQTDAAINFGNSGGPLINVHGEVVGINSAISSRAPNIGFAVPINQAREILPQLMKQGRVSRGYIGVGPRDIDPDLQRSLGLRSTHGVLVQEVTSDSPGARAGIRIYDRIVAVDGKAVSASDELIQIISSRKPGATASLQVMRDDRPITISVKLAERPPREGVPASVEHGRPPRPSGSIGQALGLSVRDLDREFIARARLPEGVRGIVVSRVEPMSPAFDAEIERGHVLLEINRRAIRSVDDYHREVAAARSGDVLAFYVYKPELKQRTLQTVRIE